MASAAPDCRSGALCMQASELYASVPQRAQSKLSDYFAYSILPTTLRLGPAFSWARTEGWCMSFGK